MQQSDTRKYTYLSEIYSREHKDFINIDKKYRRLYLTDIDNLWVERDNDMLPLAMIDLKWHNELYEHNSKNFDHALITGYVKFCFYLICFVRDNSILKYKLIDYVTREELIMDRKQYAEFLLNFRDNEFCKEYKQKQKEKYKNMSQDEIKTKYPHIHDVFFKNKIDNKTAERQPDESLHDYLIRKEIPCFCRECLKK